MPMTHSNAGGRPFWLLPLVVAFAIRAAGAWVSHAEPLVDVDSFFRWAKHLEGGINPYSTTDAPANYPPLWLYICWGCLKVAQEVGCSFDLVMKLFVSACDAATVIPVGLLALRRGEGETAGRAAALAYALNPVSILIAAFHAQNDPLVIGLAIWCMWLVTARPFVLAGELGFGLLGASLAIKPIGVLFLPLVLAQISGWQRRARLFAIAGLPLLLTAIPFLFSTPVAFVRAAATYRGPPDFGYIGIFNSWMNLGHGSSGDPIIEQLHWSMRLFYLPVFLFIWWRLRRFSLIDQAQAVVLSLFLFYGTLGAQYLMWLIPFAAARRDPRLPRISILTAIALVAFYQLNHPGILSGVSTVRWQTGIVLPQWSGIFLVSHFFLYVQWLLCLHEVESLRWR